MIKLARIFIIIGMVSTFFLIVPIFVGLAALKRIDNAKSTDELQTWAIISIFFCGMVGGILMLLIKQEELDERNRLKIEHN